MYCLGPCRGSRTTVLRWATISLRSSRTALSDKLVAFIVLKARRREDNTATLSANMIAHNLVNGQYVCVLVPRYIYELCITALSSISSQNTHWVTLPPPTTPSRSGRIIREQYWSFTRPPCWRNTRYEETVGAVYADRTYLMEPSSWS